MAINKNKVMEVAQKFVEKGQLDKAIKEYLKIVEEDPRDVRVWLKLGDLYAKKNAKQEATDTYLRVAQFYGEQGFYLKAVAVYKQVLKLDPRLIEVNIRLAEVYRQLGLLSDAMQQYELVAAFYHREGKPREALATIRELVELDPENVATRIKLAELYSKEQMIKEAVAEFTKAADYLRANGRIDDFMKVAERLVWHQPDNHAMNRELAQLYLKRNDPRHALQKLQACFKADPRDVETLALLAAAFLALDQKQKTISVWKELARIHGENNQPQLAADVYRKILAVSPDDGDALAAVGGRRAVGSGNVPVLEAPSPGMSAARVATPLVSAPTAAVTYTSRPAAPVGSEPGERQVPRLASPVRSDPPAPTPPVVTLRPPGTLRPTGPGTTVTRVPPPPPRGRVPDVSDGVAIEVDEEKEPTARAGIGTGLPLTGGQGEFDPPTIELEIGVDSARADESDHRGELIAKILSEADVYVKYGIREKAAQHLLRVFDVDPRNVEAHERLKDVYLALGRKIDAAGVLARLVELSGGVNPGAADGYLRELSALSPGDPRVGELAMRYRIRPPALPMPAADDDEDEAEIEIETVPQSSPSIRQLDSVDMIIEPESSGSVETTAVGDEATQIGAPAATRGGEFIVEETQSGSELIPDDGTVDVDGAELAVEVADPEGAEAADAELAFDEITGGSTTASDKTYDSILAARALDDAIAAQPASTADVEIDPHDEALAESTSGSGERPAAATSLEDDLDEADFFVSQNLFDEARTILGDLLSRHPGHPLILAKLRDLDGGGSGVKAPARSGTAPGLGGGGGGAAAAASPPRFDTSAAITDDSGARRRPAVIAKPLGGPDVGTHYDLGMAYKEMGLHDEAIKEFALVREAPAGRDRAVQCYLMIGLCQAERGHLSEAVDEFKAGLYVDHITEREAMALYFELGAAYEALGDVREALYYFEKVQKREARFRDVDRRIEALKSGQAMAPRNGRARSGGNPAVGDVDDSGDDALRAIDSLGEPGAT